MEAAKLKIKTVIDNSNLGKGIVELKEKLKNVASKINLKDIGSKVGSFFKTALSGALKVASTIFDVLSKIGIAFGTAFAGGIFGMTIKKAVEDSETLRGNFQYLLAMIQTGIENIVNALLPAVTRMLEVIVNLAYKLLVYINMLTKAWFGLDLFAGVDDRFAKNMKNAANSAKKIKKELQAAPFDEFNKVTEAKDSGSSGSGLSFGTPNLKELNQDLEKPGWLKFILDNGPLVAEILGSIATTLILIKLGIDPIKSLGIGTILGGIVRALEGIVGYIKDPSWKNFGKVVEGIGAILFGAGLVSGNPLLSLIGAIVFGLGIIAENWKKISDKVGGFFHDIKREARHIKLKYGSWVADLYNGAVRMLESVWGRITQFFSGWKQLFNGIIEFFKGVFTLNWEKAWNGLKDVVYGLYNAIESGIKWVWDVIFSILRTGWDVTKRTLIDPVVEGITNMWNTVTTKATDAWNGMKRIWNGLGTFFKDTFTNAWNGVKRLFSTGGQIFEGMKDGIVNAFVSIVNALIRGINKLIKIPFDSINKVLKDIKKMKIFGQKPFDFITTISVPQIPQIKLAKGGIVNNPGRGVPIANNIIAGEKGAEAVLPLNDSVMENLASRIGKYVRVDNVIDVNMDSRRINRILKSSEARTGFAVNR